VELTPAPVEHDLLTISIQKDPSRLEALLAVAQGWGEYRASAPTCVLKKKFNWNDFVAIFKFSFS
jgi:hypothetical protein